MKKVITFLMAIMMCCIFSVNIYAYPITYQDTPLIDKSQAKQFLKDRNTSQKMLNCIDFIYEYGKEVGIEPGIVVAMSSIETGYGKSNLFVNHNNPGGIKARNGWAHYSTPQEGYRAMMNLLATYAGLNNNTKSYLFGKARTTQELGNYYWVENGCDSGYHSMLSRQIETIRSYTIIKDTNEPVKQQKKNSPNKKIETPKNTTDKKQRNGIDIIYDILNKGKTSSGYNYIMNLLK